ncbi:N-acetylmuramoyl-L-alanine amidase [Kitasatospora sp. NPDC001159]
MTATETDGGGHLTAWAGGSPQPTSSNLNWTTSGVTTPRLVVVPLGPDGKVNLLNGSWNTTHLIADVFGYYV